MSDKGIGRKEAPSKEKGKNKGIARNSRRDELTTKTVVAREIASPSTNNLVKTYVQEEFREPLV